MWVFYFLDCVWFADSLIMERLMIEKCVKIKNKRTLCQREVSRQTHVAVDGSVYQMKTKSFVSLWNIKRLQLKQQTGQQDNEAAQTPRDIQRSIISFSFFCIAMIHLTGLALSLLLSFALSPALALSLLLSPSLSRSLALSISLARSLLLSLALSPLLHSLSCSHSLSLLSRSLSLSLLSPSLSLSLSLSPKPTFGDK